MNSLERSMYTRPALNSESCLPLQVLGLNACLFNACSPYIFEMGTVIGLEQWIPTLLVKQPFLSYCLSSSVNTDIYSASHNSSKIILTN